MSPSPWRLRRRDFGGLPHPTILAAARPLGIDEVYAIGGAQAIAAFAYGIPAAEEKAGLDPVDVVTGPGNVFVATAKRLVKGVVGIDSEAGTTEIAILADATARPGLVAADLISQAEHDPKAASVLITDSVDLAAAVRVELERQAAATKHSARVREASPARSPASFWWTTWTRASRRATPTPPNTWRS